MWLVQSAGPDAIKAWQKSARQLAAAQEAAPTSQSATRNPGDADDDSGASLTSSSEPLMAAFYLDASVAKRRAAKVQLEAMGFRCAPTSTVHSARECGSVSGRYMC